MAAKLNTAPSAPMSAIPTSKIVATVDAIDAAHTHALKLQAMLLHAYGESGDAFRNMRGDIQDNYMWLCSDMANSIVAALEASFEVPFKSTVGTP